ncbi:MAG: hypothetical protein AAB617_01920, partial [Patescibacteria group bacterium]
LEDIAGRVVDDSEEMLSLPRWMKILMIIAVLLPVVIIGAGILYFFHFSGGSNVSLDIKGPDKVYRGVPFELVVDLSNSGDRLLSQAELTINLPDKIVNLNGSDNPGAITESIGDIGAGSFTKKTYKLLPIGDVGTSYGIGASLSYSADIKSRFKVNKNYDVLIEKNAIDLEIKKPTQVLSGSNLSVEIIYKNNSDYDFPEIALEAKYPQQFKFISGSLAPSSLNNYWRLGELRHGSTGSLKIEGVFSGNEGDSLTIPVVVSAIFLGKDFPIKEEAITFGVAPSPLKLEVLLNGRSDYVARIGDRLVYTIKYQNNTGIALADAQIKAVFSSELFDSNVISTNGIVDSLRGSVVWDASKITAFRLLDPGSSGEISLELKLKNIFPARRLSDKNFYLRFGAEMTSPSVPYYLSASKTRVSTNLETKVSGLVIVDAKVLYRDASALFVNYGFIPPKVGQKTQYSVHWIVRNYSTDIKDVVLSSALEPGVSFTGQVKSNINSVPLYDESSRTMIWNIDGIAATTGVLSDPVEAIFQIEAVPFASQVGGFQPLLGETKFKALDNFTGLEFLSSDIAINSSLPDDITIGQVGGRVVP